MIGNERMNDASSVPSSPRSRSAAAVTSISLCANRPRIARSAPLREPTTDSNAVATPSLRPPAALPLSHLPPPSLSLLALPPPPASLSPRQKRSSETPLAPPRPRPPRSPRALESRATPRSNARGHARRRPRERAHPSVDRERTLFDRSIVRSIDRSNTDRPRGTVAPVEPRGRGRSDRRPIHPNLIAGLDDAKKTTATPRRGTWVCEASRLIARANGVVNERALRERIARIEDDVSRKEEAREGMMTTTTTRRGRRRGEEGSEVVVRGLNGRIRRARPTCARRRRRRRRRRGRRGRARAGGAGGDGGARGDGDGKDGSGSRA